MEWSGVREWGGVEGDRMRGKKQTYTQTTRQQLARLNIETERRENEAEMKMNFKSRENRH